jgi:hypothetical protein
MGDASTDNDSGEQLEALTLLMASLPTDTASSSSLIPLRQDTRPETTVGRSGQDWEGNNETITELRLRFSKQTHTISNKDFRQKTIDGIFNEKRLFELEAMLKGTVAPLEVGTTSNGLTYIKSTKGLVSFYPTTAPSYFARRQQRCPRSKI